MKQRLYVWMDDQDLVGQLDFNVDGMRQSSVFTYAQNWIDNPEGYDLSFHAAQPDSRVGQPTRKFISPCDADRR